MKKIIQWMIVLMVTMSLNNVFAQWDTSDMVDLEDWDYEIDWPWRGAHPFVEVNYGYGIPKHKNIEADFTRFGSIGIKLGYSDTHNYRKHLYQVDDNYFLGTYSSDELNKIDEQDEPGKIKTEMWRFGFGNRLGYGYELALFSLLPYNQIQCTFTKLEFSRDPSFSPSDIDLFERYEGTYRFGISTEGGVKFELFKSLAVIGSYETAVVYPRVIFFKWFGSVIIQTITLGLISRFAEDIVDSSPVMGPLMYAILRNGAGYGLYYAMQSNMYWPFKSEKPFTHEMFRLGASITF